MRNTTAPTLRHLCMAVIVCVLSLGWDGCAYVLYVPTPPSQERVKIIGKSPDRYVVHLDVGQILDYQVPPDGRVTVAVPAFSPSCGIYLFNLVKVGGGDDPLGTWNVTVSYGGNTLRKLSVKQMRKLPTDVDGYRLLRVPG
jgi:hypothetical protein